MNDVLPHGWADAELGQFLTTRNCRVIPSDEPNTAYVGLEHVESHTNRILKSVPATSMASASTRFAQGDVLYARLRPYLNKVAIPAFDGLASAEFIVFPERVGIDNRFVLNRMSASDFVRFACSQNEGDRPRVKFEQLSKFSVALPPSAEQTRIVEKLEELLSDLDAAVAELKAAQKKLALYRQSLLKAAVDGSLTAEWRKHNKPTETGAQLLERILSERRDRWEAKQLEEFAERGKAPSKDWCMKYSEPIRIGINDLPTLPSGWIWTSINALISAIQAGKSFKCEERPPQSAEVGVVKVSAVTWGEYNEEESKTCNDEAMICEELFVNSGDFLFSRANTVELVGACVIARTVTKRIMLSDKILRLIFVADELKHWVLTFLRSQFGRRHIEQFASGNQESMRNIGQERLRQIPIPLPSMTELDQALKVLASITDEIGKQEDAIELALKRSAAQRQNILRAAFSGQLVPQDPNDEPASVLLERIRAERAAETAAKQPKKSPRSRKASEVA